MKNLLEILQNLPWPKIARIATPVLALLLVIYVVATPIGPVSGYFIGGTATEAPAAWPDTSDVHEILLKVPGFPPRVVTIWVIEYTGDLYVVGSPDNGWTSRIGDRGKVAMRLGDNTYSLVATRTTVELEEIITTYAAKYIDDYPDIVNSFPSVEEAKGQAAVFRLTAF